MPSFINLIGSLHQKMVKPRQSSCIVDYLVRFLPNRGKVLDVGCGTGKIARMVCEKNSNLQLKGIDILVQSNAEIEVQQFDLILRDDDVYDSVYSVSFSPDGTHIIAGTSSGKVVYVNAETGKVQNFFV